MAPSSDTPEQARTSLASGPFLSIPGPIRTVTVAVLACAALLACGGGPREPSRAPAPTLTLPSISGGGASSGADAEAARLLGDARRALTGDSLAEARSLAQEVVDRYPGAPGSSEGLWIVARVAHAQGDDSTAVVDADRFSALLPSSDPLLHSVRLLRAEGLAGLGRWQEAVVAYLRISAEAPDSVRQRALEGVGRAVQELSYPSLQSLTSGGEPAGWAPLGAPVAAEYALALHVRGRSDDASEEAQRALSLGAQGAVAELARSILAGRVTVERRRAGVMGVILPSSGSPGERQYSSLIDEGIRARIVSAQKSGGIPVSLVTRDDSGSVEGLPGTISAMDSSGTLGIIGPLGNQTLAAAAAARTRPVPIISPTAVTIPPGQTAVYSLSEPDPGGADSLASFAAARGLKTAVVLHARSQTYTFEANRFVQQYEARGGQVLGELDYEPGATFFGDALQKVRSLLPDALVLPVPAGDIPLLAPELTYFGLDTLGIRILGTEDWGDPSVVQNVSTRHTDGVVLATPRLANGEWAGWGQFVQDYESVLQQTLRSRVPALGYDAAGLLLRALSTGARDPVELQAAIDGIHGFPGATGTLSVVDGHVRRDYHLVRLRDREMIPIHLEAADP